MRPRPAAIDSPLLAVSDIKLSFGGIIALDGVSFGVAQNEICGLIGPNGAGKTTLFNCITRLYQPDSGSITLAARDLLTLRSDQIAGAGIARTFQNIGLVRSHTVLENVIAGSAHRTRAGLWSTALGLRRVRLEEHRETARAMDLLSDLGLAHLAHEPVTGLPFGTLKRIELTRALMVEPTLLLLDEPANGLIHEEVDELGELIRGIRKSHNLTILLVEHHMGMVLSTCDRVVVLNFGRKLTAGSPQQVRNHPDVIEAYLGGAA